MVPTLVALATAKCAQHVSQLQDVGSTPFHLVKPILKRANAKQLDIIETASPHLSAHTDGLWYQLVERDFPDRPAAGPGAGAGRPTHGSKALYFQYVADRERFRSHSAQRLRRITERLAREKSAKSIVAVAEFPRDPTVRSTRSQPTGDKNSILNRARRDVQHRSFMFRRPSLEVIRPPQNSRPLPPKRRIPDPSLAAKKPKYDKYEKPEKPTENLTKPTMPTGIADPIPKVISTGPKDPNIPTGPNLTSPTKSTGPTTTTPAPIRKRREPSIFLNQRRSPKKPPPPKKTPSDKSPPSKLHKVRSSIFS